jgi:hypothetical protein
VLGVSRRAVKWVVIGLVAAVAATGCNESGPSEETLRLLEEETPAATGEASPGEGETPAPEAAPRPTEFPQECREIISFVTVAEIVAIPMRGSSVVYQDDFPDSPREERLVCQYGTEAVGGDDDDDDGERRDDPAVSIIMSSYQDAAGAADQLQITVDNARVSGRTIEELEIAGRSVFSLASTEATSYVLADEELTYVVTLARDVVPTEAEPVVLHQLVEELLGVGGSA